MDKGNSKKEEVIMGRYTIRRMKQSAKKSFNMDGRTFYRVSLNGKFQRDFTSKRKAEMYIADQKRFKGTRLSLAQIKARETGFFFSKNTMRFFRGARYSTRFDKKTGINYIRVRHRGQTFWHRFDLKTGSTHSVSAKDLPFKV